MRPTERFSDRARDYARFRPGYPDGLVDLIATETGLEPPWTIADIGSGTGLSARPFLDRGHAVIGVEPNADMRAAGDSALAGYPGFRSVSGTAEATTLPDASVDLVVVAQAFHWFDPVATGRELRRVLRPGGWVALLWNSRRTAHSAFLQDYEQLLLRHAIDYHRVRHDRIDRNAIADFFGGPFASRVLHHADRLDLAALTGRLLSASYTPPASHPGREPMLRDLGAIYERHQQDGRVAFELETEIHVGRLGE